MIVEFPIDSTNLASGEIGTPPSLGALTNLGLISISRFALRQSFHGEPPVMFAESLSQTNNVSRDA